MMKYIDKLLHRLPILMPLQKKLYDAVDLLERCVRGGNKILVCGNGGSAADAEHIVGELMKGFLYPRPVSSIYREKLLFSSLYPVDENLLKNLQQPIPAFSLVGGTALPTAFANDANFEYFFAQQVFGLGKAGDVLWAISTSGNSANIIHALRLARAMGVHTLGLTGRDGGIMARYCDVEIRVPENTTPEIQELHLPVYHAICAALEKNIFAQQYTDNASTPFKMLASQLQSIQLIVFDFDGVFTDNKVIISQDGLESVQCSRADSLGLAMLKKKNGPECCILSTEENPVVQTRAKKLGITCFQGCTNKKEFLLNLLQKKNLDVSNILYIGNDMNDFEVMSILPLSAAPADAHPTIRKLAPIKLQSYGGNGAIRELCDIFLEINNGE